MPKVYAPQLPSRYDAATKLWIPTVNVESANQFGEVKVMLPPNANRLHIAPLVAALKEQMQGFGADDYVVAIGDPSLIAAASCIAVKKTAGWLRMLKWDRQTSQYIAVEVQI